MTLLLETHFAEPNEAELQNLANGKIFTELLTDYPKRRFNHKRPGVRPGGETNLVSVNMKRYDLYFRVTPVRNKRWDSNTLVIARIHFHEQKKGHGTDLMTFLVKIAGRVGYTQIGIEQTNENSKRFGAKLGFTAIDAGDDMLASVEEMTQQLAKVQ